jgi:hypothetical protein
MKRIPEDPLYSREDDLGAGELLVAPEYGHDDTLQRTRQKRELPKTESDYPTATVQRALMVSGFISKHSLHAHYEDIASLWDRHCTQAKGATQRAAQ